MSDTTLVLLGVLLGASVTGAIVTVLLLRRHAAQHAELIAARGRLEETKEGITRRDGEIDALEARLGEAGERQARLDEQLKAREQALVEQRQVIEQAKRDLGDTFRALGAQALQANNQQFLDLAQQKLRHLVEQAKGEGEKRHHAIDAVIKPLREALDRQASAVQSLETKREGAYKALEEQIRGIARSHEKLETETSRLVTALRRPEQRGRWGEMQLRNAVEMAGMTRHCDFHEQVTTDDDSSYRPDMIVHLPGEGQIVVDAKVAIDAYLDALEPGADRENLLDQHANQVVRHYKRLARKRYWEQFERTPKLVVMFMPLESALVAALEVRPNLHAEAMSDDVLIATPTLLVALLRAVAYGWQQEAIAQNAREIAGAGRELYDRLATFASHLDRLGRELEQGTRAYNDAVGSLERMVLPSARRLRELHATSKTEIKPPSPTQTDVRSIAAPELLESSEGER